MKKASKTSLVITVFVIAAAIVFVGFVGIQAQMKIQVKPATPPGLDKPPEEEPCLDDGVCDVNETLQCPDCQFFALNMSGKQIVMAREYGYEGITRIYQFKYNTLRGYENTWGSEQIKADGIRGISVGDIDGDSIPEITAVVKSATGKPTTRIYMYKEGSDGTPDYVSPDLGRGYRFVYDSIIADADSDGWNELIIAVDNAIKIFRWNGEDFINIWNSRKYPDLIFSVDVGDADNDYRNEIVLAPFSIGSAVILESLGGDNWGDEQLTEPIPEEYYRPGFSWLAIDYAKVRDADNLRGEDNLLGNEIVAGGNNNRLMIWKFNEGSGAYDTVFIGEDLGGFTQGADVGDIDGDLQNEVFTLSTFNFKIYKYTFVGYGNDIDSAYDKVTIWENYPLSYLAVGNIDGDLKEKDEIFVYGFELSVLEYNLEYNGYEFSLKEIFPRCGYFEIWEE